MSLEELQKKAVDRYLSGFNCSESVFLTMTGDTNIIDSRILKIASGFGGGLGRQGLICGCVSAAVMVLGLKYGRDNNNEKIDFLYQLVNNFCDEFKKRFGSLDCNKLIGLDLSTAEGKRLFNDLKIRETRCTKLISETISILGEI